MTLHRKLTLALVALAALMALIGSGLHYTGLVDVGEWLMTAGFIPVLWGAGALFLALVETAGARRPFVNHTAFLGILTGVGGMLAWTFGIILADQLHVIGREIAFVLAMRGSGIIFGLMVAILGNALPKMMLPRAPTRDGAARGLAYKRFAGWTYVLGALLYIANWLVLPIPFPALFVGILIIIIFGMAPAVYGIWLAVRSRASAR